MYFQEITYKTAYALGFLAADGWVNKNTLGFALKGSDRNAVIRIRDIVSEELGGRDIRVKDYMSKLNNKEYPAILNTCSNCGNTFYSRLRLDKCAFCNRGISDHIGRSGSAEKTCKLCGKQFMAVNDYDTCVNCRYIEHQKMEHPEKFICQMCGTPIKGRSIHNICRKCASKQQEKASISAEILAELLAIKNYTEIGREYGVSATAIKKKAIKYGLYERKKANYNNTEGIEQQVLNSFLSILNVKKTAEICNIPDWKARGILKKFNSDYGKLIITGEPVTDNFGICYHSVSEAAKQLGDIGYRRHIIENLDRIRATAYGRVYTRITLEDYVEYLKNRDTTDLGKIYNNLLQQLNSMVCE